MVYAGLVALLFTGLLVAMWFHFQRIAQEEKLTHGKKLRVANNKLKLLTIIGADMGKVTKDLTQSIGELRSGRASAKSVDSTLKVATRVFDDMNTLLAIWNGDFRRSDAEFDVLQLLREQTNAFKDYIKSSKKDLTIECDLQGSFYCLSDQYHLSRCYRAMLAQAIKQSESGVIEIKVDVGDAILSKKADITITITDASTRPPEAKATYEIVPDRISRNPHLRADPSAMVRLNVAQHTAIKLGGRMTFRPLTAGNMMFRLSILAEPVASKNAPPAAQGKDDDKAA